MITIDYISLIPILVEALQEQQVQIEELSLKAKDDKNKIVKKSATVDDPTVLNISLTEEAELYQNIPNPFSIDTEIKYYLPEEVINATIYIYNLQGAQIKSIPLYERGEASETVYGSELQAGMYIYCLIADGKEIDSKRMILTD